MRPPGRTLPKATDNNDMYSRKFPNGNFLFFFSCKMSLFCLPCGKLPLSFLAVPAGKDGRVKCSCQTVDDFIGVRGGVCGLFLFVQTHTPLIVPPWQSRARKSKFHFYQAQGRGCFRPCTCGWWLVDGLQVPVVMRSFRLLQGFQRESVPCRLPAHSDRGPVAAWQNGELSAFPGRRDSSGCS